MAKSNNPRFVDESKENKDDFVDISSSSQVDEVYHPGSAQRRNQKKRRKKINATVRVVSLVLSLIMLVGGGVVIYFYYRMPKYENAEYNVPENDAKPKPAASDSEATISEANADISFSIEDGGSELLTHKKVLNILLFGRDSRSPGTTYGLSDTMILLSIDTIHKKLKLTSFQRDTYVYIPGVGDDKINAAFSAGGPGLAIKTVETNFGVKVDKYATVDFDSFRKIINILGGIDIELSLEEIKYINAQIDVNHQLNKTSFLEYDPSKETQMIHLDGYQALWYARDRGEENLGGNPEYSFDGDDWDRTVRQRNLIQTIIKYLKSKASLGELIGIVNDVGPMITTNLKKEQILYLAQHIMTYVSYEMVNMSLPSDGTWRYDQSDDGQSIIFVENWKQLKRTMGTFIYEDALSTAQ